MLLNGNLEDQVCDRRSSMVIKGSIDVCSILRFLVPFVRKRAFKEKASNLSASERYSDASIFNSRNDEVLGVLRWCLLHSTKPV